jgi:5-methylcytosine-specific restriction endonuclease McrA
MFGWFRRRVDDLFGGRSPRWRAVRAKHLQQHPTCAACGASDELEVHHLRPVWLVPESELSPENLLTLCGPPRNCHWSVGHGYDTKAYRPDARSLAARMLRTPVIRPKTS